VTLPSEDFRITTNGFCPRDKPGEGQFVSLLRLKKHETSGSVGGFEWEIEHQLCPRKTEMVKKCMRLVSGQAEV
jgi:hypothetical protein